MSTSQSGNTTAQAGKMDAIEAWAAVEALWDEIAKASDDALVYGAGFLMVQAGEINYVPLREVFAFCEEAPKELTDALKEPSHD